MLNLDAIRCAAVHEDPFRYFVATNVVGTECAEEIGRDFPRVSTTGSHPVACLTIGPAFACLVDELRSPAFVEAVGHQLTLPLDGLAQLITVRAQSGAADGAVHTDAEWKIVSALLYLNRGWHEAGGALRLLRSHAIDDVAIEVPPDWGTLIVFRRSERSFHGHRPFFGERRLLQINWVTDPAYVRREERRHRRSLAVKAALGAAWPRWARWRR